jgi:tetratricopeptide (TPR) repeat protein
MWSYKGTFHFDIGSGYGDLEYDFFRVDSEEDFDALIEYYRALWSRFNYLLDGYSTTKNDKELSPRVKSAMKEHDANICLAFMEEDSLEFSLKTRQMIVSRRSPENRYHTSYFNFFHFNTVSAYDYYEQGKAFEEIDFFSAAITYYTQAVNLDPNSSELLGIRGRAYLRIPEYDRALEDFTRAVQINPNDAEAYSSRGLAYAFTGDYDAAIADYDQAVKLGANDSFVYIQRGAVHESNGDIDLAKTDYAKARKLAPERVDVQEMIDTLKKRLNEGAAEN